MSRAGSSGEVLEYVIKAGVVIFIKRSWLCMAAINDSGVEDVGRGVEMVVVGAILGGERF
jgi:hypothetical protein